MGSAGLQLSGEEALGACAVGDQPGSCAGVRRKDIVQGWAGTGQPRAARERHGEKLPQAVRAGEAVRGNWEVLGAWGHAGICPEELGPAPRTLQPRTRPSPF